MEDINNPYKAMLDQAIVLNHNLAKATKAAGYGENARQLRVAWKEVYEAKTRLALLSENYELYSEEK